ncbi:hypothetical protein [Burkholderia gladioli]|uniref:hypothetical protein n=1 Tax=Burkholderia gladioli TaxID=28095 RepID=UPI003F794622
MPFLSLILHAALELSEQERLPSFFDIKVRLTCAFAPENNVRHARFSKSDARSDFRLVA